MLRSNIISQCRRLLSTGTTKTWASKTTAPSLKASTHYRDALLDGIPSTGPPSLRSRKYKQRYSSPEGINEAFDVAYDFLKSKSEAAYAKAAEAKDPQEKAQLETQAELHNPEVNFNFAYNEKLENDTQYIDYELPVYRELKKKHWENYGQMLTMQRLETLAAIPDTLPTLEPKAEISLKFQNHTGVNRWVEAGKKLSSNATTFPPSVKIQEFDALDLTKGKYTILIVNPDVPDIENNTYKTQIAWGLSNLSITYNDNFINPAKLLKDEGKYNEIISYLPPVPEKNLPAQRFVTWVFRQGEQSLDIQLQKRDFDIRQFVEDFKLEAIGAHIWRSEWDLNVREVRELYGLPQGTVFAKVKGTRRLR
ncbi:hypothetical protein WICPIJ_000186 [Wickerhamomyces pijperi]|uniref:Large ribosomal subunit protein mL38 n=1 Tax=Wickerhamomyces pijperi TaxID=599730 RepID=A0A9P8QEF2_WICPI|nr:hypothetical protein WICPIJ_000186 [Wickerhamomyces pijperi]